MTDEQQQTDQQPQPEQPDDHFTVSDAARIQTLEIMVGRNAIQQALMQAGVEQLGVENRTLTERLAEVTQQRNMFQARASELAEERRVLAERLAEYEPDADVIELETPESDEAAG